MIFTLDSNTLLVIIIAPSCMCFLIMFGLSLGDMTGTYFKNLYIHKVIEENKKLIEEHKKWRENIKEE